MLQLQSSLQHPFGEFRCAPPLVAFARALVTAALLKTSGHKGRCSLPFGSSDARRRWSPFVRALVSLVCFFVVSVGPRDLVSFPARRSCDLVGRMTR